jgi:hypothetical protein
MQRAKNILQTKGEDSLAFFLKSVSRGFYGYEEMPQELSVPLADPTLNLLDWASRYRSIDDRPFTLDPVTQRGRQFSYAPLRQIYLDNHPFQVIQKPSQRGLSELAINKACHALDIGDRYYKTGKRGLNVAYIFPTQDALDQFSKERFAGLIQENEYLAELFRGQGGLAGYDNIRFKQARDSYLYLRGAYAATGADKKRPGLKSFSADILLLDELDEMDRGAIALAEKRLSGSPLAFKLYFSTPTNSNEGINKYYLMSDMQRWLTPCNACAKYSQLDFFRDVFANGLDFAAWSKLDRETLSAAVYTVHCINCSQPIPDETRFTMGHWEAERPEIKSIRGYLVPALCFAQCNLAAIAVSLTSEDSQQVTEAYRQDLGIPYELAGSRLTEANIKALTAELENGLLPPGPWHSTTMGIDVGRRLHYCISSIGPNGRRYVRAMGTVKTVTEGEKPKTMWEFATDLLKQFKVRRCVVDAGGEPEACERWAKKHEGIVFRAFYPDARKVMAGELWRVTSTQEETKKAKDEGRPAKENIVQIARSMAMDGVYNQITTGAEIWAASCTSDREVLANMTAPVRNEVTDAEGETRIVWQHKGPDHFYHACVYNYIARLSLPKGLPGAWSAGTTTKGWGG